jgi:hypothetical protein
MTDIPNATINLKGAPITEDIQEIFGTFTGLKVKGLTNDSRYSGGTPGILVQYEGGFELLFVPCYDAGQVPEESKLI